MCKRRVRPSALPCFEMPRHKGSSLSDRHQKKRGRAKGLPFFGIKTCLMFKGHVLPPGKISSIS